MAACKETQRAIGAAIALEDLEPRVLAHADMCDECEARLDAARSLALVTIRARRGLEAMPDLPPSSWVRIRGVAERGHRGRWLPPGAGWLTAATGVALALGLWMSAPAAEAPAETVGGRALAGGLASETPPALALAPRAATEDGVAISVAAGARLQAEGAPRTITAFGRHRVTVAAASEVDVLQWSPRGIQLRVVDGAVTCDVKRAGNEGAFEVFAGDVRVTVMGTRFTVARGSGGKTRVAVERGEVRVTDAAGAVSFVSTGQHIELAAVTASPKDAAAPTAGPGGDGPKVPEAEGKSQRAPLARHPGGGAASRARVVEIEVPDQQMEPNADGVTGATLEKHMGPVYSAVRDGNCYAALAMLKGISKAMGEGNVGAEVHYLMAWCHRKLGHRERSTKLFERYRRMAPAEARPLPANATELPPRPTAR